MNIIIVGCGKVGTKIAQWLSQEKEHNITVIDLKYEAMQELINQCDLKGVTGSGASREILMEAGIKDADILVAVTGSDELNLLTCLIARKTGNCKTVARVRKPEYSEEADVFKEDLGLAMIINPEQAAATEIARALRFPAAIQTDGFAKEKVDIFKFKIAEKSVLDNLRIADISLKLNCDILVCGVERGDKAFIPNGNFVLKSGDLISVVASLENGGFFLKRIGVKASRIKDVMIVGGGEIGYYLAKQLIENNIKVKIIEKNPARCDELYELIPKATIINENGTKKSVLMEEGIENAQAFIALTNIDEENIMLSLFARSKTDGKLVTKINSIDYDEVINRLNLDTVIHPKNITAEHIVKFVRSKSSAIGSNIETMHRILEGKAEAIEFGIGENSPVSGTSLEKLNIKSDVLVACINRKGTIIIPRGRDVIMPGDTVIIITTRTGFKDVSDILE